MIHQKIKDLFESSVEHICSDISEYSIHPNIDFRRNRKISPQTLISFLVSQGSSSTKVEMLDFWGLDASSMPTSSALNQQRQKLKPAVLEAVFKHFNSSAMGLLPSTLSDGKYRFLAADGSTCTYFSTPSFSSDDYYRGGSGFNNNLVIERVVEPLSRMPANGENGGDLDKVKDRFEKFFKLPMGGTRNDAKAKEA